MEESLQCSLLSKLEELTQINKKLEKELTEREKELAEIVTENEMLLEANDKLKKDNLSLHDQYTRTALHLNGEIEKLNDENKLQADNYVRLKREKKQLEQRSRLDYGGVEETGGGGASIPEQLSLQQQVSTELIVASPTSGQIQQSRTSVNDKPLDLAYLMRKLAPAADVWKQIGTQLKVPQSKLNSIHNENITSDMNCLTATLDNWMKNPSEDAPRRTISSICDMLRSPPVNRASCLLSDEYECS